MNLDSDCKQGLASLKRRVKSGEIIVLLSDRSGRFSVCSPESYLQMGKKHTDKDQRISWEEVSTTQERMNGHVSMWAKMVELEYMRCVTQHRTWTSLTILRIMRRRSTEAGENPSRRMADSSMDPREPKNLVKWRR